MQGETYRGRQKSAWSITERPPQRASQGISRVTGHMLARYRIQNMSGYEDILLVIFEDLSSFTNLLFRAGTFRRAGNKCGRDLALGFVLASLLGRI